MSDAGTKHLEMSGLLLVLMTILCFRECSAVGRQKRVVNGMIITDRQENDYSVIKYFVWIGYGRDFAADEVWDFKRQTCGGALLTTSIVQSACHCYTDIVISGINAPFQPAVYNGKTKDVVVGYSEVDINVHPLPIQWYIIHPGCGEVSKSKIINDFALLVLREEVQLSATVTMAPVYPLAELAEMWTRFTVNENVCLVIGFGRYISVYDPAKSAVLRHTWHALLNYPDCYHIIALDAEPALNITQYQKIMTKSCYRRIFLYHTEMAPGDSGSPVTCDNKYFGLNSQSYGSGLIDDVVFYAYANSLEYRLDLIEELRVSPIKSPPRGYKFLTFRPDKLIHPDTTPLSFLASITSSAANARITNKGLPRLFVFMLVMTI